jgi:hypothetical protein
MIHRKVAKPLKPKDIVEIALKNLVIGDGGIFCTSRTYANVKERIREFSNSHRDRTIKIISYGGIRKIKRVEQWS